MIEWILLVGMLIVVPGILILLGIKLPKTVRNRLSQKKVLFVRIVFIGGGILTIFILSFCFIKYPMDTGIALKFMVDKMMGRYPPQHSDPAIRIVEYPTNEPIIIHMVTKQDIATITQSLEDMYQKRKIGEKTYRFHKKYIEKELANIFFFQNPSKTLKESWEWKKIDREERKLWPRSNKNPRLIRKLDKWLDRLEKRKLIDKITSCGVKKHFERLFSKTRILNPEPYTSFLKPIFSITIKNDFIVRLADKDKVLYARLYGVVLDYDGIEYGHLPFELSEKEEQIKRLVKKVLSEQTSTVGTLEGKKTFEDEIKRKINEILDEGQIESVHIEGLLIQ